MLLLSVIITAYNVEPYIRRCIESVEGCGVSRDKYEVIVVDDGSEDNSPMIARELASKYDNIKLVFSNRLLNGGSRNEGLKQATGKYIKFVDGDDYVNSSDLALAFSSLETCDYDIIGHDFLKVDCKGQLSRYDNTRFPFNQEMSGVEFLNTCVPCRAIWFCFYRRQFLEQIGLTFRPYVYHEDEDFYIKAFSRAKRIVFLPFIIYFYYYNRPQSTINNTSSEHFILRMDHYVALFRELRQFENSFSDVMVLRGIRCNVYFAITGYIRLMVRHNFSQKEINRRLGELSQLGYYPLPLKNYGAKYLLFRFFANHPNFLFLIKRYC